MLSNHRLIFISDQRFYWAHINSFLGFPLSIIKSPMFWAYADLLTYENLRGNTDSRVYLVLLLWTYQSHKLFLVQFLCQVQGGPKKNPQRQNCINGFITIQFAFLTI